MIIKKCCPLNLSFNYSVNVDRTNKQILIYLFFLFLDSSEAFMASSSLC